MSYRFTDLIRRGYRAEVAHRHVVAISQHHRIQASPGFRGAAAYVAEQLEAAGLAVTIRRYPADGASHFWSLPSFLEWSCARATLHRLGEDGAPAETLCDYEAIPTSVIQRSIPVSGEFEVIAPGGKGGVAPADYDGIEVADKLVLTGRPVAQVLELAGRQRGAAGILFDGMEAGGRTELDLPDARQYTSFWWAGATQPDGWGFVLSPRQGRALRAQLAEGKPVHVRAAVNSRFYVGSFEVVDARIPGADDSAGEVLLVSHLCHPQPGAHDNGSGAAALIETAATLARLIAAGELPPPRRGIRFLWPPEMTGTYAWLAERAAEVAAGRWVAGLNLDMVGADQNQTGSSWQFVNLPQAGAAFADHLLAWLRGPFLDGQRHAEILFSAGSDHYILSDPTVGIPTPMLIQWPDKFYHTSADTADKVAPESLGRSGALAAAYAYWLAAASPADAGWLGHWMVTRAATQMGQAAAAAVEALHAATAAAERGQIWSDYAACSAFRVAGLTRALRSLLRLDSTLGDAVAARVAEVTACAAREDEWVRDHLPSSDLSGPARDEASWLAEAETLVPRRLHPGPVDVAMALQAHAPDLLPAHWALNADAGPDFHDHTALMQYWTDGRRTVAEIADLVALEAGGAAGDQRAVFDGGLALRYFKLLAQAGLVALDVQTSER